MKQLRPLLLPVTLAALAVLGVATHHATAPAATGPAPAGPFRPLVATLPGPSARRATPVPADTSARGLAAVWADLRRRSYFLEAEADGPARRVAANAAQRLTARLAPAAYELAAATPPPAHARPGATPVAAPARPAWTLGLTLRGIGRGGQLALRPVAAPTVAAATDTSVRYQHGGAFAVEYTNTEAGVRQNYYLAERPAGDAGPVQVRLSLATTLRPTLAADGQALAFAPAGGGAPVLRYGSLRAWDATGRQLPARLRLAGATTLALEVNDAGAAYPLTIDPLASTPVNRFDDPDNVNQDFFGRSVAGVGDVNGDGYADVVIGAPGADNVGSGRGSAFLYLGSAAGLGTTAGTMQRLNDPTRGNGDNFGNSVAGAGDVNGDGYGDVVISAYRTANGGTERGTTYLYLGSATGLGTSLGTTAGTLQRLNDPNNANGDLFGRSVAGAGDVNGDGYADVVVGASDTGNGGTGRGSAYLYLGSAAGLGTAAGTTAGTVQRLNDPNNADGDYFGRSVAGAGDVNGDGYADVFIGAYGTNNGGNQRGSAYLYLGSATGLGTSTGTTAGTYQRLNNPNNVDFDFFGWSVAGAGDINGDGYADVLVGASGTANGGSYRGSAFLYLGSAAGLGTTAGTTAGTVQRLDDPNNTDYDYFSYSVAGAGDVNGDGYADVAVGANNAGNGGTQRGSAYLFVGSPGVLLASPGLSLADPAATNGDYFGWSVAGVGDVNGDGYGDVLVGAYGTASQAGQSYLYLGSATGLAATPAATLADPAATTSDYFGTSVAGAGDVNGDGYADVLIGASGTSSIRAKSYLYLGSTAGLATTPTTTLTTPAAVNGDRFGFSVAGAGDVNGDGYADVVIGAYLTASGQGQSYLYLGAASGLGTTPAATLPDPAATNGDYFGRSVAGAGDVNGDGYADVLVGAYGTANRGQSYLYLGSPTGLATTPTTTLPDPGAVNGDSFGRSVAGAGDVNGDGYADVLIGASAMASNRGQGYLYLGSATGLVATPAITLADPAAANGGYFGFSVAGAGDVNGDGYADVLVGAYGTASSKGQSYLYRGNQGDARPGGRLRLYNTDLSTPLGAGNRGATQFGLGLTSRSVLGRTRARLVWEVAANGAGFLHASPVTNSVQYTGQGAWMDLGTAGTELKALATKTGRANYVRARLEYASAALTGSSTPGTGGVGSGPRYGPWQYVVSQQQAQLNAQPLPVQLVAFTAQAAGPAAVALAWTTASEAHSARFEVQRSPDGVAWVTLGEVAAAGSSATRRTYAYLDGAAPAGRSYYRLRLMDVDGSSTTSPVRVVVLEVTGLTLCPNPSPHGAATLHSAEPSAAVRVFDALGRVVATATTDSTGSVTFSGFAPGLYLVRVGGATMRLVVE